MSTSRDIFAQFGIAPTSDAAAIESAIQRKTVEIRRAIARGEVDGAKATASLAQQARSLRATLLSARPLDQPVMAPTPPKPPPPAPAHAKTTSCRTCNGLVAITAATCPHCGETHPGKTLTPVTPHGPNIVGMWFAIIGGTLAILMLLGNIGSGSSTKNEPNPYYLRLLCEDEVKARLKSPATAIFNHNTPTTHSASGTVDSQNSFGALLRSQFYCSFAGETVTQVSIF